MSEHRADDDYDLVDQITVFLFASNLPLTDRQIADGLGVDLREVRAVLFGYHRFLARRGRVRKWTLSVREWSRAALTDEQRAVAEGYRKPRVQS